MNKLTVSTGKILSGVIEELKIKDNDSFVISDSVSLHGIHFPNTSFKVSFFLDESAVLTVEGITTMNGVNGEIKIISTDDAKVDFRLGICASEKNHLDIYNEIQGSNNESKIKIRIISEENAKIFMKTTGDILEHTQNNTFIEDVRYLNEYPGSITCLPELKVASDECVASHNMTVGNINEEVLFYLESKGIKEEDARQIIRDGFIKSVIERRI